MSLALLFGLLLYTALPIVYTVYAVLRNGIPCVNLALRFLLWIDVIFHYFLYMYIAYIRTFYLLEGEQLCLQEIHVFPLLIMYYSLEFFLLSKEKMYFLA